MNIEQFWQILEQGKDSPTPQAFVKAELEKIPPEEIIAYQEHFAQLVERAYRWDLWGAAYLINGGCSDDSFMDFRYGLLAQGKQIYEKALANPDNLADFDLDGDGLFNESFGYVAAQVYEAKTHQELPTNQGENRLEPLGEEWDFDDDEECQKRLPKLWAKFVELEGEEE
jgi:hypothetical protein